MSSKQEELWVEQKEANYEARQILGIGSKERIIGDLPDECIADAFHRGNIEFCDACRNGNKLSGGIPFKAWELNSFGCCYCSRRYWGQSPYQWRKMIEAGLLKPQETPDSVAEILNLTLP